MDLPTLVLIHGGAHAGDCWDPTVAELRRQAPQLPVLAVDLPGRAGKPGDLRTVTAVDFADSVVADVEAAGADRVVVAAHSMGGLTAPRVAARLGRPRVCEVVFVAAFVPPHGSSIVDAVGGPLGLMARAAAATGRSIPLPAAAARVAFWNGMSAQQRAFARSRLCLDSLAILTEPADLSGLTADMPKTWILTSRDKALPPRKQRQYMAAAGGVDTVVEIDTCHNVMISEPARLAEILLNRCLAHA
jgi:pimeloyl-ACP methyl ester carboxylesterase